MARLQLIFPLLLWVLWKGTREADAPPLLSPWVGGAIYIVGLAAVVAFVAYAAAMAMRRTTAERAAPVPRFHRAAASARWLVLAWHGVALWSLGYGDLVLRLVPDFGGRAESLPLFASVLPMVWAWVGLIGAQYPLERGVREQNALWALELGEPVRPVPDRLSYTAHAVRSQILFTLTPLLAVAVLRDGLHVISPTLGFIGGKIEYFGDLIAGVLVFVFAPELLRRVLPTQSLPASVLRDRLVASARRLKLGVRDILLWHTHHGVGNAAVMGVVPGVRYVMITDVLVERMPPEQLEAVFAHEAGHVVHKHIAWYAVYFVAMTLGIGALETPTGQWLMRQGLGETAASTVTTVAGLAAVVVLFGALSRKFERQADLFAARRIGASERDGAALFGQALRNVARINNMPLDHRPMTTGRSFIGRVVGRAAHHTATWLHGSIRSRIDHVARLADDARAAGRFDRLMVGLRVVLLVALAACVWMTVRR